RDREDDVVRRCRRFTNFVEERRIEDQVQRLDRIEPGGVRMEQRILVEFGNRMIVEELDQAQRNRNRELPAEPLFLAFWNGPVGGVVAREAAAAAEVEPAQTDEAGVDGLRRQRCREGTDAGGQGEA